MVKNDGGSAFPFQIDYSTANTEYSYGMTLRDYFAAKAMQGLMANSDTSMIPDNYSETESTIEVCSSLSYQIADAMIAEQEKE